MNAFKSLSQRERTIAIVVVVLVVGFLLYQFLIQPYLAQREALATERTVTTQQLADADRLFKRRDQLKKVWTEIKDGGLKVNHTQAGSQAHQAVLDWAQAANMRVLFGADKDVQENQFQVISFRVTTSGPMASIAKLLWSMETATIPVRVSEMQLQPRRDNIDELDVQMTVSTLCLPNDTGSSNERSRK